MSTYGIDELTTLVTRLGGLVLLVLVARIVLALALAAAARLLAHHGRRGLAASAHRAALRVTPVVVRGVLVAAIGATTVAAPAVASAAPPVAAHAGAAVDVPVLDRLPAIHAPSAAHVVRPGESLWSIAGHEWRRWYAANRALIGPDPALIRPGQVLQAPQDEA